MNLQSNHKHQSQANQKNEAQVKDVLNLKQQIKRCAHAPNNQAISALETPHSIWLLKEWGKKEKIKLDHQF